MFFNRCVIVAKVRALEYSCIRRLKRRMDTSATRYLCHEANAKRRVARASLLAYAVALRMPGRYLSGQSPIASAKRRRYVSDSAPKFWRGFFSCSDVRVRRGSEATDAILAAIGSRSPFVEEHLVERNDQAQDLDEKVAIKAASSPHKRSEKDHWQPSDRPAQSSSECAWHRSSFSFVTCTQISACHRPCLATIVLLSRDQAQKLGGAGDVHGHFHPLTVADDG